MQVVVVVVVVTGVGGAGTYTTYVVMGYGRFIRDSTTSRVHTTRYKYETRAPTFAHSAVGHRSLWFRGKLVFVSDGNRRDPTVPEYDYARARVIITPRGGVAEYAADMCLCAYVPINTRTK